MIMNRYSSIILSSILLFPCVAFHARIGSTFHCNSYHKGTSLVVVGPLSSSINGEITTQNDTNSFSIKIEEEEENSPSIKTIQNYDPSPNQTPDSIIKSLLMIAASTDRGQFSSTTQTSKIQQLISKLESSSSTLVRQQQQQNEQQPTKSQLIGGTWELLYSNTQLFRSSPFFMAGRAVCSTSQDAQRYDWFCDMHRAALAISTIGKVRQIIDVQNGRMISEFETKVGSIPFLSDVVPALKYSGGLPFAIDGAIVSSADISPTVDGKGWEIFMDTVEIKGSNVPLLRQVLDNGLKLKSRDLGSFLEQNLPGYNNPKPVFTTTYLDDSIRISRDQDGKVFVYGKVSDDMTPTDYKSIDSDLGILKLLEGVNDNFFKFYL